MKINVICDFDGTISLKDSTGVVLERFAPPEWREIEEEWVTGKIGSAECMKRQIELVEASPQQLDELLDTIEIDGGFKGFIEFCRENDITLQVVSDGVDYFIQRVFARYGIEGVGVYANHLLPKEAKGFTLTSPYAAECCKGAGMCKCGFMNLEPETLNVLIGDGRSDFAVSSKVDKVFAKGALLKHCQSMEIDHIPFSSFEEVGKTLYRVLQQ